MSDLIRNGKFDFPGLSGSGHTQFVPTPQFQWDVAWVNGSSTTPPKAEVQRTQQDGQYLELASTEPYEISQTIAPQQGEGYVFAFRAKARAKYKSDFLARLKKADGVMVEYHISPGPEWKTYTFCQCSSSKEVAVSFVGLGEGAGGAFLDDVRYVN